MVWDKEVAITYGRFDFEVNPKPPFRVDLTLKVTSSNFKLCMGEGFIRFAGDIQESGGGILRTDILTGKAENVKYEYGVELPINEFFGLAVVCGSKAAWIEINGRKCYISGNAPYMQMLDADGALDAREKKINIAVTCGTKRTVVIKSFKITEYETGEPSLTDDEAQIAALSPFEWYLRGLSPEIRAEALVLDELCMVTLKKAMKFSRSVDKYGYLTYKTACGLQYEMRCFGTKRKHSLNWVQGSGRADLTNQMLANLHKTSPSLAESLFGMLKLCSPHKRECDKRTTVELNGVQKQVCRSKIPFKMQPSEFGNICKVILAASEVV
jgi:hypothetical protein